MSDRLKSRLLQLIFDARNGLKISEIESKLDEAPSRRTLQRQLQTLLDEGKIGALGERSARRYYPVGLPVSEEAERDRVQITQPLHLRKPVAYNTSFLYDYMPNHTFYLPETVRKHLHQIGRHATPDLKPGTYANQILHRLLVDLSWNSSRLEGNTYSLLETERLLDFGAEAEGRAEFEAQMILNHKAAIEFMVRQIDGVGLDKYVVLNIHALLSHNLLANLKARGQLRHIPVQIGRTTYQPPTIPQLIESCFSEILARASKIQDPFEQSFFLMVQLLYLQPFEDVNKRVSRVTANLPLLRDNLSPLSFIDVPQQEYISAVLAVYELNHTALLQDVYVWAYERSAQHYKVVEATLTMPNVLRLRYRQAVSELVRHVVCENIRGPEILKTIAHWSEQHIPAEDQTEFARLVETEITSLHRGNIAVYNLDPDIFSKWRVK